VDMATYKAEFLSHYWKGRVRPRSARAFGLVHRWARFASRAPGLVNALTRTPVLAAFAKAAAGMAPERAIPAFARQTFRSWFLRREVVNPGAPPVLLFADTFNNFFHPETARAGVEVLEAAGFRVTVPRSDLCCGRPLYDFGMLDLARGTLRGVLDGLRGEIRGGVPVIVLEPSCAAVFRDELLGLLPDDADAKSLSGQTFVLAEFLRNKAPGFRPPRVASRAILQGHCHQRAIMTMTDEEELLRRMGVEFETPEPGCCGMAGSFGFESGAHYDVSMKCAERALLPEVRRAPADTLIIADGFSCREQIRQGAGRAAMHLAEVLRSALSS